MIVLIIFALFIFFGVGIILFSKNLVHTIYALALVLVAMAGVYVLLYAHVLAIVQILLYVGGIVILLAFGVMMTNRIKGNRLIVLNNNVWIGGIISIIIFLIFSFIIHHHTFDMSLAIKDQNQFKAIGLKFLTDHIVAFELIAFILLVALVGAAYIAKTASDE